MKGFILLGVLSILSLAVLVKDVKTTSTAAGTPTAAPTVSNETTPDPATTSPNTATTESSAATTTPDTATTVTNAATTVTNTATTTPNTATTTSDTATTTANTATTTSDTATTTANTATTTLDTATTTANTATTTLDTATTTPNTATTTLNTATVNTATTTPNTATTTGNTATTTPNTATTTRNTATTTANTATTTANTATTTANTATTTANTATTTANTATTTANTATTTANTATTVNNQCKQNVCSKAAKCVQLYEQFTCQCPVNFYHDDSTLECKPGDSVFGKVELLNQNFSSDTNSKLYTEVYDKIIQRFSTILLTSYNAEYRETIITDIREAPSTRQARDGPRNVIATLINMFISNSVDDAAVNTLLSTSTGGGDFKPYVAGDVCEAGICDPRTTTCTAVDTQVALCTCKAGYFHGGSNTITSCLDCDPTCNGNHQQCIKNPDDLKPECVCLPGYKRDKDKCKECDFGYSGKECKDDFELILVIVGCVLGAAVIALIGAVIGISVRSSRKKKDIETRGLLTADRNSGSPSPMPGNLFPKVQAKSDHGHVNTASNVYDEDQYNRSIPKRDYEEDPWYEMSPKDKRY